MKSRLTIEALVIFLLGGVPLIASYLLGGAKNLETMTTVLVTSNNFLTYYLISLFVAFLTVGSLNWLIWKPTNSARKVWRMITTVLHEAGSGALGIIRVAAGVLLTFPLIWLIAEPENFKIEKVAHLILYGIIAYGECVIISGWYKDMYYENSRAIHEWASVLENFPRHSSDVFLHEIGSEIPEDRTAYYFRLRVFNTNSAEGCAIQLRFNNNQSLPDREIFDFCIRAEPSQINRLGKLLRTFAELRHEVLEWNVTEGELHELS